MQIDNYIRQINRAATRYESNFEVRDARHEELMKIREGRSAEVDISRFDSAERIGRRFVELTRDPFASENFISKALAPDDTRFDVLERIINQDDLMSADFLAVGASTSKAVGRVVIRNASGQTLGHGTCFLVSARLAMTNNHVLETFETAANSTVQFDFVETLSGQQLQPIEFAFAPQDFFETDETLDFTLVAVELGNADSAQLSDRGWTPLIEQSGKAIVGERVNILQHPRARRQQLALRKNEIIDIPGNFLHYTTDTDPGSSGSPALNDQWQLAALHHAGVPKRDSNRNILRVGGGVWDRNLHPVDQISWIANEGVRISQIVERMRSRESVMSESEQRLFNAAFTPPTRELTARRADGALEQGRICPQTGRVSWTIPIEFSVQVPLLSQACDNTIGPARQRPAKSRPSPLDEFSVQNLDRARRAFQLRENDTYYDAAVDGDAINFYYADIADELVDKPLYEALHALLRDTHTTELSYNAARYDHLYPWIDLQQDPRTLLSVYSGKPVDFEDVIEAEARIESRHGEKIQELFRREAMVDEAALTDFRFGLETQDPFNCEHVVPQSWFNKKQPMKADLHHLFTCEPGCNSFRGNEPYFEFPLVDEGVQSDCGRVEKNANKFEPDHGKGVVARATLYFLLRYPGLTGDEGVEMTRDRLPTLRKWHRENPVTDYERHRNAEIAKVQGNRNPLIDFPDWEHAIPFEMGFSGPL